MKGVGYVGLSGAGNKSNLLRLEKGISIAFVIIPKAIYTPKKAITFQRRQRLHNLLNRETP